MGPASSIEKNAIKKANLVGATVQSPLKGGYALSGLHSKITLAPARLFSFETVLILI